MGNKYAKGGRTGTDTVHALLTPGEVVLNKDQQHRLANRVGQSSPQIFKSIGVPGFQDGGKVRSKKQELYSYILKKKLKRK